MKTLTLAFLLGSAAAAAAQPPNCAPRDLVIQRLAGRYGETLRNQGLLSRDSTMVEVFSSEETGTWTILMTRPDGLACLLAAGQQWEQVTASVGDPA